MTITIRRALPLPLEDRFVLFEEGCELLGLNPRTTERRLRTAPETLPPLRRLGRVRVFRREDLIAHLSPPAADAGSQSILD
jgi:hypothetical protein